LAVNQAQAITNQTFFWGLVIETKKGLANPIAGLPQLLTYAYKESVWD
jgi:hypothetical protein